MTISYCMSECLWLLQEKLSTVEMTTLTLTWNCMDDTKDILENCGLEETILASRIENFNYITTTGVDLDMIKFEDKTVIIVNNEVSYCVAGAIWLLESCIT